MPRIGRGNLVNLVITGVTIEEIHLRGTNNLGTITTNGNLIIRNSLLDPNYRPKINDILKIRADVEGINNSYRATRVFQVEYPDPGYELGLKVIHDIMGYYLFEIIDAKRGPYSGNRGYVRKTRINNLVVGSTYDFVGEIENISPVQHEGTHLYWEIAFVTSLRLRMAITFSQNLPNLINMPSTPNGMIIDESGSNLSRIVVKYLISGNRYCQILSSLNSISGVNTSLLNSGIVTPEGYVYTQDQMLRIRNELGGYGIIRQNDFKQI